MRRRLAAGPKHPLPSAGGVWWYRGRRWWQSGGRGARSQDGKRLQVLSLLALLVQKYKY